MPKWSATITAEDRMLAAQLKKNGNHKPSFLECFAIARKNAGESPMEVLQREQRAAPSVVSKAIMASGPDGDLMRLIITPVAACVLIVAVYKNGPAVLWFVAAHVAFYSTLFHVTHKAPAS